MTQSGHVAAGGADKITIGTGPSGGFVQEDAGMWTIENERELLDLEVVSNNLFIFCPNHIYVFTGYSYDTFALSLSISDMGLIKDGGNTSDLVSAINRVYFIYGADIYEFDGDNSPRIISKPVYLNNALTNSILGGINLYETSDSSYISGDTDKNNWHLAANKDKLIVYASWIGYDYYHTYFEFDFRSRTWWKKTPFIDLDTEGSIDSSFLYYLPTGDRRDFYTVSNDYNEKTTIVKYMGCTYLNNAYVITKAFNTNPSETGTLTALILMISSEKGVDKTPRGRITVYYSLSATQDDFIEVYQEADHLYTGDIETIEIPMPVGAIANAHHYRIKIEVDTSYSPMYLYNIERRFRVQKRSR